VHLCALFAVTAYAVRVLGRRVNGSQDKEGMLRGSRAAVACAALATSYWLCAAAQVGAWVCQR
jgi:hypothetical protein